MEMMIFQPSRHWRARGCSGLLDASGVVVQDERFSGVELINRHLRLRDRHGLRGVAGLATRTLVRSSRVGAPGLHAPTLHCRARVLVLNETLHPGEDAATVAGMTARATGLEVRFVVGLHRVALGAFLALPLLLSAMLPAVMLLDAHQVAQRMRWVVVQARPLRADVHALGRHKIGPLQQLPWHLVAAPVHLQVLVALESLVADFANVSV